MYGATQMRVTTSESVDNCCHLEMGRRKFNQNRTTIKLWNGKSKKKKRKKKTLKWLKKKKATIIMEPERKSRPCKRYESKWILASSEGEQ